MRILAAAFLLAAFAIHYGVRWYQKWSKAHPLTAQWYFGWMVVLWKHIFRLDEKDK